MEYGCGRCFQCLQDDREWTGGRLWSGMLVIAYKACVILGNGIRFTLEMII